MVPWWCLVPILVGGVAVAIIALALIELAFIVTAHIVFTAVERHRRARLARRRMVVR
jgi:hypothetical protein